CAGGAWPPSRPTGRGAPGRWRGGWPNSGRRPRTGPGAPDSKGGGRPSSGSGGGGGRARRRGAGRVGGTGVVGGAGGGGAAGGRRAQVAGNADALDALAGRCEQFLRDGDADRAAVTMEFIDRRLAEGAGEAVRDRAERCRADLALLRELDRIDTFRWIWVENKPPDPKVVAARWQEAFAGYGVVPGETPA